MYKKTGNIEILLLLGCLVGVVAFFSLTLAISSVISEQPELSDVSGLKEERDNLIKEKLQRNAILNELKKKQEQLLEKRKELEEKLFQAATPSPKEKEKLEQLLKETKKEYRFLEENIKKIKEELSELIDLPDPKKRIEIEKKIKELENKLLKLKEKINKTSKKLAGFQDDYDRGSYKDEKEKMRTELKEFKDKKKRIENEVGQLKIKILTAGTSRYNNPLYVDCKRDFYVIYPREKVIEVKEVKKRNILKELSAGHDIIVLYVRPGGFKSFREAYAKIKTLSIARCYEPIEADQKLDMLKRINQ